MNKTLEQILSALSSATEEELTGALQEVNEAARASAASNDTSEEAVTALEALAEQRTMLKGEFTRRQELAARHSAALSALAEEVEVKPEEAADDAAETEQAQAELAAESEDDKDEEDDADAADSKEDKEEEAVTASGRPLGGISKKARGAKGGQGLANTSHVAVTTTSLVEIPIDSGSIQPGQHFSRQSLAQALSAKAEALRPGGGAAEYRVARMTSTYPPERTFSAHENWLSVQEKIEAAQTSARAEMSDAQSLVAAGGLCGPLEVRYDIEVLGSTGRPVRDALLAFGADRGGITYRGAIDGAAQQDATGFWTVQNDIDAGTPGAPDPTKTCLALECPATLNAQIYGVYHCVELPNMTSRFDPEWADAVTRATRVGHDRKAENQLLSALLTASKQLTAPKILGAARDYLVNLDRAIAYLRSRRRLTEDVPLTHITPMWVLDLLRADITNAMHTSNLDALGVANSQIRSWFAERNVNVAFHMDGNPAAITGPPAVAAQQYANATAGSVIPEFPDQVDSLLFTAGEWLFLDGGALDLGVVRDSTLNSRNRFQIFEENFEGLAFTGVESLRLTMTVDPTGLSAGTVDTSATEN